MADYYRESTPSQGWAAEDLARGYDMLVNGGTGAEDFFREAAAWGMSPDAIREAVQNAALVNRQREQNQLNYRANVITALANMRARESAQERIDRYREALNNIRLLRIAENAQKGTAGTATPPAAFSDLAGDNRNAILDRMRAGGLNPQDIATIDKLRAEGRENEINPQVYRQYVDARQNLANDTAQQQSAEKGPKRTLTDQAKTTISAFKGMSEADKGAFTKYYQGGDYAGIRSVPGGEELMNVLKRQPGQPQAQPKQPKQESAAQTGPGTFERLMGFLSPGEAYAAEPPSPQGQAKPTVWSPDQIPNEPLPFEGDRGRQVTPAGGAQYVRDPNSSAWRIETPEEAKANTQQNPMKSYFKPLDQATINRLNSTDEYGRNLDLWGNPLTNARGEMLSQGETYSQPMKMYGGMPQAGREAYLQAKLGKAHAAEAANWEEGRYVGKGAPEYGLGHPDPIMEALMALTPSGKTVAGTAAGVAGAGLLAKRLAGWGAREAAPAIRRSGIHSAGPGEASWLAPGSRTPAPTAFRPGTPASAPMHRPSVPYPIRDVPEVAPPSGWNPPPLQGQYGIHPVPQTVDTSADIWWMRPSYSGNPAPLPAPSPPPVPSPWYMNNSWEWM